MDRPRRDVWLDALRGVAVLLVLGRHLELPENTHPLLAAWQRGGWVGVDLFFVLSGFLVSGLLFRDYQRRGSIALPRFLLRRGFRIYPAFFVLLLCTWLVSWATGLPRTSGRGFAAEFFFVQNYFRGVWNHTWSLAVEEHFYLGLPLLLLGLLSAKRGQRDPFGRLMSVGIVVIAGMVVLRCVQAWRLPYSHRTHLFPTHLRIDSLLIGVMLSYAWHFHRQRVEQMVGRRRLAFFAVGVVCFVPAFMFELETSWFLPSIGLTFFAVGAALLIAAGLGGPAPGAVRWLAPIGGWSYSIYLWHMPMLIWGVPLLEYLLGYRIDALARTAVYLAGSVASGCVMAWTVERPWLYLRDRLVPTNAERGAATANAPMARAA